MDLFVETCYTIDLECWNNGATCLERAAAAAISRKRSLYNSGPARQAWARACPGATSLEHRVVVAVFRK